jgi:hypothetical protein
MIPNLDFWTRLPHRTQVFLLCAVFPLLVLWPYYPLTVLSADLTIMYLSCKCFSWFFSIKNLPEEEQNSCLVSTSFLAQLEWKISLKKEFSQLSKSYVWFHGVFLFRMDPMGYLLTQLWIEVVRWFMGFWHILVVLRDGF